MKSIIITVMFMLTAGETFAQKTQRFETEFDPIAYALKGYSLHLINVKNRFRTDFGVFAIRQPESYSNNKGFQVQSAGCGLKFNYLLNKKETLFAGIGLGYVENNIKQLSSDLTSVHKIAGIGAHLGYRWFPFKQYQSHTKNFYIAPWFSVDINHPINQIQFTNSEYSQAKYSIFPTVHIGYKF